MIEYVDDYNLQLKKTQKYLSQKILMLRTLRLERTELANTWDSL